jgi:hypothetical protein
VIFQNAYVSKGSGRHLYLSVRMRGGSGTKPIRYGWVFTDGVFEIPIPSITDDGWGVSLNPSVSVKPSTDRTAVQVLLLFIMNR